MSTYSETVELSERHIGLYAEKIEGVVVAKEIDCCQGGMASGAKYFWRRQVQLVAGGRKAWQKPMWQIGTAASSLRFSEGLQLQHRSSHFVPFRMSHL